MLGSDLGQFSFGDLSVWNDLGTVICFHWDLPRVRDPSEHMQLKTSVITVVAATAAVRTEPNVCDFHANRETLQWTAWVEWVAVAFAPRDTTKKSTLFREKPKPTAKHKALQVE